MSCDGVQSGLIALGYGVPPSRKQHGLGAKVSGLSQKASVMGLGLLVPLTSAHQFDDFSHQYPRYGCPSADRQLLQAPYHILWQHKRDVPSLHDLHLT